MYRSSAAVNFFFFLLSKKPNKQTKKSIYFCRFLFLLAWACVCVPLVSRSRKWEEWSHDQLEPRVKNAQDGCSIRSDYFPDGWHSWNIWTRALTNCCVAVSGRLCALVYFRWAFTSTSLAPGPFPPNYSSSSTDDVLRGRERYENELNPLLFKLKYLRPTTFSLVLSLSHFFLSCHLRRFFLKLGVKDEEVKILENLSVSEECLEEKEGKKATERGWFVEAYTVDLITPGVFYFFFFLAFLFECIRR